MYLAPPSGQWIEKDDMSQCFICNRLPLKKPQICNEYSEKLTITIWGFGRNYYVIRSRDEKMDTTTELFGFEIPQ